MPKPKSVPLCRTVLQLLTLCIKTIQNHELNPCYHDSRSFHVERECDVVVVEVKKFDRFQHAVDSTRRLKSRIYKAKTHSTHAFPFAEPGEAAENRRITAWASGSPCPHVPWLGQLE